MNANHDLLILLLCHVTTSDLIFSSSVLKQYQFHCQIAFSSSRRETVQK